MQLLLWLQGWQLLLLLLLLLRLLLLLLLLLLPLVELVRHLIPPPLRVKQCQPSIFHIQLHSNQLVLH